MSKPSARPASPARRPIAWLSAGGIAAAALAGWLWSRPLAPASPREAARTALARPSPLPSSSPSSSASRPGQPWMLDLPRDPATAPAPTPAPDPGASPWRPGAAVEPDPGLIPAAQLSPPPPELPPPPPVTPPLDPRTHTPSLHNPGGVNGDRPARTPGEY